MAEAHQPLLALALLDLLDERRHVRDRADLLEHLQDFLVRAAVQRAVQSRGRSRQRRVRIGVGRADARASRSSPQFCSWSAWRMKSTSSARTSVGIGRVVLRRRLEEHREEVLAVVECVRRIDVRHPHRVLVGERRDRRHLRDEAVDLARALLGIVDVSRLGIERGHRRDGRDEHPHRVRVVVEGVHHLLQGLVDHRVVRDVVDPLLVLRLVRELAVDEEVRHLQVLALLGEDLDRVAAVAQDSLVPVDEGDPARARRRVQERRVVGHQAEVLRARLDLTQVHRADRAVCNGHFVDPAGAPIRDRQRVGLSVGCRRRLFVPGRLDRAHGSTSAPIL